MTLKERVPRESNTPRRVRIVAAAVGNSAGRILLDADHLGEATSHEGSGTIEVQCVTLDDWCRATGIWPDVIKMDIEGAEGRALGEHARAAFEHARAIVLEVHEDALAAQGRGPQELLDWIASTGKTVAWLESRWTGNYNVAATSTAGGP